MFIYESETTSGRLDVQTRAFYLEDSGLVSVNQYLFRDQEVLSCSQVDITIEQLDKIISIASHARLKDFYKKYNVQ